MLIIHNLDAVDRPEKAHAIKSLRDELRRQGRELVVLHHSPHAIPSANPEDPLPRSTSSMAPSMAWPGRRGTVTRRPRPACFRRRPGKGRRGRSTASTRR
ncbi:MAG: hypothetical protein NVV72_12200 [Asticcacaulis sp.]|nr:hypothetical protein [Asticcacaulis sp.]